MNSLDEVLNKWCDEFIIEPTWPANTPIEEILDQYIFPQLQDDLLKLAQDREYYQNRSYLLQWVFRKLVKAYGEAAQDLERANIPILSDELIEALKTE